MGSFSLSPSVPEVKVALECQPLSCLSPSPSMPPQAEAGVPGRLPEVARLPCNPDSAEGLAGLPGVMTVIG